jgi:arylsulfatase A-like enzyme
MTSAPSAYHPFFIMHRPIVTLLLALLCVVTLRAADRPNILFIMTDDHTSQAVGAYGGRLAKLNPTPTLDELAREGMRFDRVYCNNSICTPSRASILTGQYSQRNGVIDLDGILPSATSSSATC